MITRVTLPTNDLAFDRVSGKLYASVPGDGGELGNHVVEVDPQTGEVGRSVHVGSEPEKLALSADGRVLYVGLTGAAAVRRVELPSLTAGLQFPLGSDEFGGARYVDDMEVLPGQTGSVAVARRFAERAPRDAGVAIYDTGRKRPDEPPQHEITNVIEFGDSPDRLYSYDNETTGSEFYRLKVGSSGISLLDATDVITSSADDIEFADGRLYATNGQVLDPEPRTLVGTFTLELPGLVEPVPAQRRVFFYSSGVLFEFDQETFALVESFPIEDETDDTDERERLDETVGTVERIVTDDGTIETVEVTSLVSIGGRDLAFRSSADEVVLIHFEALRS